MSTLVNFDHSGDFHAAEGQHIAYPAEEVMRSVADDPGVKAEIGWRMKNRDLLDLQSEALEKSVLVNSVRTRHVFSKPDISVALTVYEDSLAEMAELFRVYTDSIPHARTLARLTAYICEGRSLRSASGPFPTLDMMRAAHAN